MAIGFVWASALLCLVISVFIYDRMGGFRSRNHFPVHGRTVIVTGGSQGMGQAVAQHLASKGANVIIVARTVSKLESALDEISSSALDFSTQRFHYISADLTSPEEATRVIAESTTWNDNAPPPILFCCAGSAHPGYFLSLPPSILKEQMDTNYLSAAYMAHAAAKAWLSVSPDTSVPKSRKTPEPNHIVFVSSVLSFLPITGYSPYTPPKIALRALAETLAQELLLYASHTPIRTHTIFPATIFSEGYELEKKLTPAITKKLEESDGGHTAEEVAKAALKGLEKGEENVVTSWLGRAMQAGSLGGSRRRGWGVLDSVLSGVVGIILVFTRRDMDSKVRKWGQERIGPGNTSLMKREGER